MTTQACGWVSSRRLDLVDATRLYERKRRRVEVSPSSVKTLGSIPRKNSQSWSMKIQVLGNRVYEFESFIGLRGSGRVHLPIRNVAKGWSTSRQSTFLTSSLLRLTGSCFPRLQYPATNATPQRTNDAALGHSGSMRRLLCQRFKWIHEQLRTDIYPSILLAKRRYPISVPVQTCSGRTPISQPFHYV